MIDGGVANFQKLFSYAKYLQAWYAYHNLLDVGLTQGFSCETCGTSPDLIVCDGTSLGFRHELLVSVLEADAQTPVLAIDRKRQALYCIAYMVPRNFQVPSRILLLQDRTDLKSELSLVCQGYHPGWKS